MGRKRVHRTKEEIRKMSRERARKWYTKHKRKKRSDSLLNSYRKARKFPRVLLNSVASKTGTGVPDFTRVDHLIILSNVLTDEMGWSETATKTFISEMEKQTYTGNNTADELKDISNSLPNVDYLSTKEYCSRCGQEIKRKEQ
jgi:hypothetical protein